MEPKILEPKILEPKISCVSFEHQNYREKLDLSAESKRVPKTPSRLRALARNVFRWWYVPLVVVLFAFYLAVRLGAIHWVVMSHKKINIDYANLYTDTSLDEDYGSRFLREWSDDQEERSHETVIEEEPGAEITATDDVPEKEEVLPSDDESPLMGADYANLYTGASIYDFSQTANYGSKVYWRFVWQSKRSPDLVIEKPESYIIPGKCWPMRGSQGYVVIRLSSPISLSAVSYEHAPLSTLRPEDSGSAPKLVQISAGMNPKHLRVLGVHQFQEIAQAGPVTVVSVPPTPAGEPGEDEKVQFLKFAVLDNFGERRFTCLYRIRVFGQV